MAGSILTFHAPALRDLTGGWDGGGCPIPDGREMDCRQKRRRGQTNHREYPRRAVCGPVGSEFPGPRSVLVVVVPRLAESSSQMSRVGKKGNGLQLARVFDRPLPG